MENLDVIALRNELKQDRFTRLIKNKNFQIALFALTANIPTVILTEIDFLRFLSAFTIAFEIQIAKQEWRNLSIPENNVISSTLRETKTYEECCIEYKKYIKDIADLIRKTGFKSSKDSIAYLQLLMDSGHFSAYHNHEYHNYKNEEIDLIEIAGARVLTGKSVCRHQSSFFVNILNELGYTAANVSVIATSNDPIKLVKSKDKRWNHAVVGVVDKGEMYLYDPTCKSFSIQPSDVDTSDTASLFVSQYVSAIKRYLVINPRISDLNRGHEKQFKSVMTSRPMRITQDDAQFYKDKAELVYRGNYKSQYEFNEQHEKQREYIAKLYKELVPHQDEPIKEWIVRK